MNCAFQQLMSSGYGKQPLRGHLSRLLLFFDQEPLRDERRFTDVLAANASKEII